MSKLKKMLLSSVVVASVACFTMGFAHALEGNIGTVTASSLNLRSGPGLSSAIIGSAARGEKLSILDKSGNWYKISNDSGEVAWAYQQYITFSDGNVSRGSSDSDRIEASSESVNNMIAFSKKFLGVKYVWGGTTPSGFDCSGFVKYVYGSFGNILNRVAADQAKQGTYVSKEDLQPGDLVFFDTAGGHNYINHVGMYIGEGKFIQASSGKHSVVISDIIKGFYANSFMTARRIIN